MKLTEARQVIIDLLADAERREKDKNSSLVNGTLDIEAYKYALKYIDMVDE